MGVARARPDPARHRRPAGLRDPADRIGDAGLRAALLALSPLAREAIVLTACFDLPSADVAQALGITPAAFRMRAARARRRLHAALTPTTTQERPQWNTT